MEQLPELTTLPEEIVPTKKPKAANFDYLQESPLSFDIEKFQLKSENEALLKTV